MPLRRLPAPHKVVAPPGARENPKGKGADRANFQNPLGHFINNPWPRGYK